jgi:hypothetical protein
MVISVLVITGSNLMMAIGELTIEQFLLDCMETLYRARTNVSRKTNGWSFCYHSLNEDGSWKNLTQQKKLSADISPTAGQMPRLLGLAQAYIDK